MTTSTGSDDLQGADLDAPWLCEGGRLLVNGVDVAPLVDASVDGERSFAQTLRHLVMATDVWLGRAVLGVERLHPLGQPNAEHESDGGDMSVFSAAPPSWDEVLHVRAGRVAMVRDALATITAEDLAVPRTHPWDPAGQETTLSCLHVVLEEEWEHHRYAVRDLDAIAAGARRG